jgi:hypothetical protein
MVLYVARTFLGAPSEAEERHDGTACCDAKLAHFFITFAELRKMDQNVK